MTRKQLKQQFAAGIHIPIAAILGSVFACPALLAMSDLPSSQTVGNV
jgi:hypothetical protein